MIEAELLITGPASGDNAVGKKERKIWRFKGLDAPDLSAAGRNTEHGRTLMNDFRCAVWERIHLHMNSLGIEDVYGITITDIREVRQVYPPA